MATLSGTSTDAEVWTEFDDTASYHETASVALARRFVTAVRILIRRTPQRSSHNNTADVAFDLATLKKMLDEAVAWIAANDTTPSPNTSTVKFADFGAYRG